MEEYLTINLKNFRDTKYFHNKLNISKGNSYKKEWDLKALDINNALKNAETALCFLDENGLVGLHLEVTGEDFQRNKNHIYNYFRELSSTTKEPAMKVLCTHFCELAVDKEYYEKSLNEQSVAKLKFSNIEANILIDFLREKNCESGIVFKYEATPMKKSELHSKNQEKSL